MQDIVNLVSDSLNYAGFVQVEVSARHVHLDKKTVELLFGENQKLTFKRELSQPGQFLSEQRVTLIGPKGSKTNVAILGPERPMVQVELSKSDCISLGVKAPIRESGDVKGSGSIKIEGPKGTIEIAEGVIIAKAHVHVTNEIATKLNVKDKELVDVDILTDRPVLMKDIVIRVSDKFNFKMHIDFDEANGANVEGFVLGKIMKK
ncbi:MAG: phosphate propanoyltransferase [Oscillospiraceae bacterium]